MTARCSPYVLLHALVGSLLDCANAGCGNACHPAISATAAKSLLQTDRTISATLDAARDRTHDQEILLDNVSDILLESKNLIGGLPPGFRIYNPSILQLRGKSLNAFGGNTTFAVTLQVSNMRNCLLDGTCDAPKTVGPIRYRYFVATVLLDGMLRPLGRYVLWDALVPHYPCNIGDYMLYLNGVGDLFARVQGLACDLHQSYSARLEILPFDNHVTELPTLAQLPSAITGQKDFRGMGLRLQVKSEWVQVGMGKNQVVFSTDEGRNFVEVWPYKPRVVWEIKVPPSDIAPLLRQSTNPYHGDYASLPDNLAHGGSCCVRISARGALPDFLLGVFHFHSYGYQGYRNVFYAVDVGSPEKILAVSKPFCFARAGTTCPRVQVSFGLARWQPPSEFLQDDAREKHGSNKSYIAVTYGENDCSARMRLISEDAIADMLLVSV